jgi:hypothetical protein
MWRKKAVTTISPKNVTKATKNDAVYDGNNLTTLFLAMFFFNKPELRDDLARVKNSISGKGTSLNQYETDLVLQIFKKLNCKARKLADLPVDRY